LLFLQVKAFSARPLSLRLYIAPTAIGAKIISSIVERIRRMKGHLLIVLAGTLLILTGANATAFADQNHRDDFQLSMMGMGGGMMNNHGYSGRGDHMGLGRFGQDHDNNPYMYPDDEDRYGERDGYRQDEQLRIETQLRAKRRALSSLIRSGNPDPDEVDRKINEIERFERMLDDNR
jgi:hypothetical protein